ncbi:MAG: DNA repair protein RecN [Xanthomonadaceae bacterium]|nr:DNA repair protein RecN [Xanthomonadaceae bacterium]
MLELLRIKNIAVIDQTEISFESGLNIISGETGAGKSIVIESINLILGGRAQTDLIRTGCEDATVEGLFDLTTLTETQQKLIENGFPVEDNQLLIKRVLSRSGKHRVFINGELANLQSLARVTDGLIDCCGQHENQTLLKQSSQIELLDRFGNTVAASLSVSNLVSSLKKSLQKLSEFEQSEQERIQRTEFLKFQIEELENFSPVSGEEEALQQEKKLFSTSEARRSSVQYIIEGLSGSDASERSVLTTLKSILTRARSIQSQDDSIELMTGGIERGLVELEESSLLFSRYADSIDHSPERMNEVQTRLAKYAELRRKYACSGDELAERFEQMKRELSNLDNMSELIENEKKMIAEIRSQLKQQGEKISQDRKKFAKSLSEQVSKELQELKMEQAQFLIEVKDVSEDLNWSEALGPNTIQFLIKTNAGDDFKSIGTIASGGELSRVLLSIRRVIADQGGIGVYLFDEIDAGIGGQTAFVVGRKLKSVAKHNQVICITHVPQVAAFADHHLSVIKTLDKKRTFTSVLKLTQKDRTDELARMLGGEVITKKSLENAKELLAQTKH